MVISKTLIALIISALMLLFNNASSFLPAHSGKLGGTALIAAPINSQTVQSNSTSSSAQASIFQPQPVQNQFKVSCPLSRCLVIKSFQMGPKNWNAGHRGVDLSTAQGRSVYAPADGEVIHAGLLVNRGVVSIRHEGDLRSTFEPVIPLVTVGEKVKRGELVALVTDNHCDGKRCLHWGMKKAPPDISTR
ncbi:M23 family metallopeptidase [Arcanobacterium hippocoleae]